MCTTGDIVMALPNLEQTVNFQTRVKINAVILHLAKVTKLASNLVTAGLTLVTLAVKNTHRHFRRNKSTQLKEGNMST